MKTEVAHEAIAERLSNVTWERVESDLDEYGGAVLARLLSSEECEAIAGMYPDDAVFRSRVVMARHGFGRGEYKYFAYPLPDVALPFEADISRACGTIGIVCDACGSATRLSDAMARMTSTLDANSAAYLPSN